MSISKGTIIRTILMIIVVINIILKQFGFEVINISETQIEEYVELIFEIGTIIVCWWKNNSFTAEAIQADELLKKLKKEG